MPLVVGDPCQLGPIIRSSTSLKHGLGVSMLERLMRQAPYSRPPATPEDATPAFRRAYVTKLVKNYRSHPALLTVPSRLFYDNELVACADPDERNSLLSWPRLPNPKIPLLYSWGTGKARAGGQLTVVL